MEFILNGTTINYQGDPEMKLLKYLREVAGLTSPKDGCSGQGSCGCCTVNVNGRAVFSCVTPMRLVEGREVTTAEGLSPYEKRVFAAAFAHKGGSQCGFCTPGMVMRGRALLAKKSDPSREDVAGQIHLHLCRCTGYKKIIDSILYAAEAIRERREIPEVRHTGLVGTRLPKYDGGRLSLGEHRYVADLSFPEMLHGALKFSDHPRARVIDIDISGAKIDGVAGVFLAKDIPGKRTTGLIVEDWPLMVAVGETTRCISDVLSAVVAETEDIARKAVDLIRVRYEVLPPITDTEEALAEGSPKIHEGGNLLSTTVIRRGDAASALAKSCHVVHGVYETQWIEHAFMETECSIARPAGRGVEVFSQGQGIYDDRRQIARILGLPESEVKVVLVPNGGAFGGKEDLSVQGHAALFAHSLQKPVKVRLTRDESIRMHPKRHPLSMDYTVGCDKDGRLTAVKAAITGDTGAYASVGMKVLERAAGHATGAYSVPAVDITARAVYTDNIPAGAMRGFGVNQVTFAMESAVDELCKKGGFDRWQFRYDNAVREGEPTATGQVIRGGAGLRATLLAVKEYFTGAKHAGIACGVKNTGLGNGVVDRAAARIEIAAADRVIIHHSWTEMGQGIHTVAVQVLCQETGIDPAVVKVKADTSAELSGSMTTASRGTSLLGNALLVACAKLKEDLETHPLGALAGKVYDGEWACDWTTGIEDEGKDVATHYSYSYATQVVILDDSGDIDRVIAAHDAGKIVNPNLFEGQIEGSIHMGLGYAMSEELVMAGGVPKSTRLKDCGVLRAKDMPEVTVIGVEVEDPHGPYGAKGVGEIGLVPTAAAVANAWCDFDGIRRYRLPLQRPKKNSKTDLQ